MGDGTIARRRFKQLELGLTKEFKVDTVTGEGTDTGKVIDSEEKEFWEMVPEHFNWEGHIDVLAISFLPDSKIIEDEKQKTRSSFLLSVPTVDPNTGQPILLDANGQPFTVDKVHVLKEFVEASGGDQDKTIVPVEKPQQLAPGIPEGGGANPLGSGPGLRESLGLKNAAQSGFEKIAPIVTGTPGIT